MSQSIKAESILVQVSDWIHHSREGEGEVTNLLCGRNLNKLYTHSDLKEIEHNSPFLKCWLVTGTSFQSAMWKRGKKSNFTVEKLGRHHHLSLMITVNVNQEKLCWYQAPFMRDDTGPWLPLSSFPNSEPQTHPHWGTFYSILDWWLSKSRRTSEKLSQPRGAWGDMTTEGWDHGWALGTQKGC